MARCLCAALMAAVFAIPSNLFGQNVEFSVAGGFLSPTGGDFADTEAGPGVDVAIRFPTSDRVTWGLGAHWSTHDVDFSSDAYDVIAIFGEPRMLFGDDDASVRPFVAGRAAWVREAITVGTQDRAASGFGVGVLAGIVAPLSDAVGLEVGAGGYFLSFGDFKAGGETLNLDGGSGQAISLRLALNIKP